VCVCVRERVYVYVTWCMHSSGGSRLVGTTPLGRWCVCDVTLSPTWLIHTWHMTHSHYNGHHLHVGHDSFTDMTHSHVRHDSWTCVTWLIHTWDMIHSDYNGHLLHVGHDSVIYGTWLNHLWDTNHSDVGHDSGMWDRCEMKVPSCVWHDSSICV